MLAFYGANQQGEYRIIPYCKNGIRFAYARKTACTEGARGGEVNKLWDVFLYQSNG